MSKRYISDVAKCPYYKSEDGHRIFCDGPAENCSIHVAFGTPEEKRRYEYSYCYSMKYAQCIIAQGQNKRFEG